MENKKHRCGGILQPRDVQIRDERDRFVLTHVVLGLVCDRCGEELFDRAMMVAIQASRTPAISFSPPDDIKNTSAVDLWLPAFDSSCAVAA